MECVDGCFAVLYQFTTEVEAEVCHRILLSLFPEFVIRVVGFSFSLIMNIMFVLMQLLPGLSKRVLKT